MRRIDPAISFRILTRLSDPIRLFLRGGGEEASEDRRFLRAERDGRQRVRPRPARLSPERGRHGTSLRRALRADDVGQQLPHGAVRECDDRWVLDQAEVSRDAAEAAELRSSGKRELFLLRGYEQLEFEQVFQHEGFEEELVRAVVLFDCF